ncbi:MAG: hypothetical protein R6V27_00035 [Balneolaceae bacterium]
MFFKSTARLLIIANVLCVLFGNGAHLHSVFSHFSDHGDIHAYVHAHPADSDHNQTNESDGKDDHQHVSATLDLIGTLSQKIVEQDFSDENFTTVAGVLSHNQNIVDANPVFLDLPPPDFLVESDHFYSFSLRGPPLG